MQLRRMNLTASPNMAAATGVRRSTTYQKSKRPVTLHSSSGPVLIPAAVHSAHHSLKKSKKSWTCRQSLGRNRGGTLGSGR